MHRLVGVELGGTKTVVVLGQPGRIDDKVALATTSSEETLGAALEVIERWQESSPIDALGIASFGPIRVAVGAADYGTMLEIPKPGWAGAPVLDLLAAGLSCPVALDTDVNAAALAEYRLGAARGCSSLVYITIGTGLGGGVVVEGHPVHGSMHPEIGHLRLRRAPGDGFGGACRFHGDCIEGLVSGPALAARLGCHPGDVAPDDPRWEPVAQDLAQLFAHLLLTLSPQQIVVGGGVSARQPHLLAMARERVPEMLAGYLPDCTDEVLARIIVPPALGEDAGPMGALEVASRAL